MWGKKNNWKGIKLESWKIGNWKFFSSPFPHSPIPLYSIFLFSLLPILLSAQEAPTYYQNVQPILQKNCIECHHVGGAGPFSLETYEDVERRADFVQMVTESRYMPPWFADPNFSHFRNEKFLTDTEIQTITAWVQGGKKKGKAPKMVKTVAQVTYAPPDLVFPMNQSFTMPGDGTEQFRLFVIPTNTEEELYIKGIDFRPGNRKLAHHSRLMLDTTHLFRADDGALISDTILPTKNIGVQLASYFWHGWVPGNFLNLYPEGIAKRLPKGSDILDRKSVV